MKRILILFLFFPFVACAQTPSKGSDQQERCAISDAEREAFLSLDYNSFDQSLPNGGWRKFDLCPKLARELIDAYTMRHADTLQKQQWDVLVWHSGQLAASMGDYSDAIAKMQQTFKPNEKPTDAFLWNPYAKATIAFLKRDRGALVSERNKLGRGLSPYNRINLRKVDSLIRCFNSSYQEAYSASCKPTETNIERLRSLAIPVDLNKPLPTDLFGLRDFLASKKIILVGEIHGTKTTPETFGNLAASLADEKLKTLVILEITQGSQAAIDEFLKTGNESALRRDSFFAREYQDGRSSKAMVSLLRTLSKLPNVMVLCMDPMEGIQTMTGQERDTGMASFINARRIGYDRTLVLAGNIHSRISIGTPWDPNYRPMGYELKQMATDLQSDQLFNILVRYGRIGAWTCHGAESSSCGARYGKKISSDYSEAVSFSSYFVWENELIDGHGATVFIRDAKISFPYVRAVKVNAVKRIGK